MAELYSVPTANDDWIAAAVELEPYSTPLVTPAPFFPEPVFTTRSLSVRIYRPTISSYTPEGVFRGEYGDQVRSWSHEVSVDGGYKKASFAIAANKNEVEFWLEDGIGRHVECFSPEGVRIWEGLVNSLSVTIGGITVDRGPMFDIGNRVSVFYSPILDETVSPPLVGDETTTVIVEDAESQAAYGIIEVVLDTGEITDDTAEKIRDTWIADNAWPDTSTDFDLFGSGDAIVSLSCVGYAEFLKYYIYNQTASSLSVTLTTKLEAILAADPNSVISTSYDDIDTNALLTNSYEGDDRDAWTIIKELVAQGDINDNRYFFGVFAGRRAKYTSVPSSIRYRTRVYQAERFIYDNGAEVPPWRVEPGEFVAFDDFLVGRVVPSQLRADPRVMFIESVNYTAPYGLRLVGGKVDNLQQMLAKLGLGGL